MLELRYPSVHEALVDALPELRPAYQCLFDDWDNYGGEPPGQYIVFSQTYGTLVEVALTLPERTPGREELLRRAIDFGEQMLRSQDDAVRSLAIDALAERLNGHPAGPAVANRLGGPELRRWFAVYSAGDWVRPSPDEIIDLWGVRDAMAPLLPTTPLADIPGISSPRDDQALNSVREARAAGDGVVLLASFGTTRLYVVARAERVACADAALDQAARDLAETIGGEDPRGEPGAWYRRIPPDERVWNMDRGDERHTRLGDEPWIADALQPLRAAILDLLAAHIERLPDRR